MGQEKELDIKRVIEQSTRKTTVSDLAKKGVENVRVLDQKTLLSLISEAVEKVALTNAKLLTDQEREKIYTQTKDELQKLMKERSDIVKRQETIEQDKNLLLQEVDNLRKQQELLLKSNTGYQEEVIQLRNQVQDNKKQSEEGNTKFIDQLNKISEAKLKAEEELAKFKVENDSLKQKFSEIETLRSTVSQKDSEILSLRETIRMHEGKSGEVNQLKSAGELRIRELELALDQASRQKESDLAALRQRIVDIENAGKSESDQLRKQLANKEEENKELQKKIDSLHSGTDSVIASKLDEIAKKDEMVEKKLSELLTRSAEAILKRLGGIKSPTGAPAPAFGSAGYIDELLASELESSLKSGRIDEKASEDISQTLKKLRSLKKGDK